MRIVSVLEFIERHWINWTLQFSWELNPSNFWLNGNQYIELYNSHENCNISQETIRNYKWIIIDIPWPKCDIHRSYLSILSSKNHICLNISVLNSSINFEVLFHMCEYSFKNCKSLELDLGSGLNQFSICCYVWVEQIMFWTLITWVWVRVSCYCDLQYGLGVIIKPKPKPKPNPQVVKWICCNQQLSR